MRLLRHLEQTFGRFAVPNLTVVLIACQVITWLMTAIDGDPQGLIDRLILVPRDVMAGEAWRLITFLTLPPVVGRSMFSPIWAFFFWYVLYLMGTALEQFWGVFRFNLYLLVWYVATVGAAFLAPDMPTSNVYLQMTIFLAFAWLYPDFQFMLFFILPVKVKWLAWLTWIILGWNIVAGPMHIRLMALAAILNFFIFFGKEIIERIWLGRRRMARRVNEVKQNRQKPAYHHRCMVCGKTDTSDPAEDFRYCSQCSGQQAYCSEHLHDHEHVRERVSE